MSKELTMALFYGGLGALIALGIWFRWRSKRLDRDTLRRLCEKHGGTLKEQSGSKVDRVALIPFRGRSFELATKYTSIQGSSISASRVVVDVDGLGLPRFSVYASGSVGSLGALDKHPRFKHLRLETEDRETRDLVRGWWPESAKDKMARLVNPRAIREGWIPALDGSLECDGSTLRFKRTTAFRRNGSYELAMQMLSELIEAWKSASNHGDAAARSGR